MILIDLSGLFDQFLSFFSFLAPKPPVEQRSVPLGPCDNKTPVCVASSVFLSESRTTSAEYRLLDSLMPDSRVLGSSRRTVRGTPSGFDGPSHRVIPSASPRARVPPFSSANPEPQTPGLSEPRELYRTKGWLSIRLFCEEVSPTVTELRPAGWHRAQLCDLGRRYIKRADPCSAQKNQSNSRAGSSTKPPDLAN